MKLFIASTVFIALPALPLTADPVRSGRAQVDWVSKTVGYKLGEPVITAFKMILDEGWHTYWINPGEAGMPLSVDIELPEGWTSDPPEYPLPVRFMTGDLHDFGYEGTVLFPIVLRPPADASGDVEIEASFDWLTCDDSACIPGDASLAITLISNDSTPTDAAAEISETLETLPTPAPEDWKLHVAESGDSLEIALTHPPDFPPGSTDVFPLTVNVAHPGASYDWQSGNGSLTATVPKSPFAPDPLEEFELVIDSPSLEQPIIVTWNKDS